MEPMGPGRRLAGRYLLQEAVGGGGMASVWRGHDEVLARPVAVKVLRDELERQTDVAERFRREALAAARLSHPNIIRIFDTGTDEDLDYIVMEYCPGHSLKQLLVRDVPIEPDQAVELVVPILSALSHAHGHGVVHRDVKPANILLGQGGHLRVSDFGVARAAFGENGSPDLTTTGGLLGTVKYISPEQVLGQEVDGRSDLYSVGVLLYEILTGRLPFEAEGYVATALIRLERDPLSPRAVRAGIPRELEVAVLTALARQPSDRFASADAMRAALERHTTTIPVPVVEAEPAEPSHEPGRGSFVRSWMLVPAILVSVAAAVIAGGLSLGRLELGGPLGIQAAPEGPRRVIREPEVVDLSIADAVDVDPEGADGAEHPEEVAYAIDGDASTTWRTERYNTAQFGNLKSGVGLWVQFEQISRVAEVSVRGQVPGWTFQIRTGDSPPAELEDASEPVASTEGATSFRIDDSGRATIRLSPTAAGGLLIWITEVAPDSDGGFLARIADVSVKGSV